MRSKEDAGDWSQAQLDREVAVDLLLVRSDAALFRRDARGVHRPLTIHPHDGEPVIETLARTAAESLAVVIKPEDISLAHVVQDPSRNGSLALLFTTSRWEGEPANLEPEFVSDLCWLPVRGLPESVSARVSWALRQHLSGVGFSTTAFSNLPSDSTFALSRCDGLLS